MCPKICTHHRLHISNGNAIPVFPECICNRRWQNMVAQQPQTQPRKIVTPLGKADTSDLNMITRWVTNISFKSPVTRLGQLNTRNPIYCKSGNRDNYIHLRHTIDMLTRGSGMPKREYDLTVIMYSAYGTHKLYMIFYRQPDFHIIEKWQN